MTAKKKTRSRETIVAKVHGRELPLRTHAERALSEYFTSLNAIGRLICTTWSCVRSKSRCSAWCSTMRKAIRAARRAFSASTAAHYARS